MSTADQRLRGLLIVAFAMLLLPCIDGFAKALGATIGPAQGTLGRFGFQALFLLPFAFFLSRSEGLWWPAPIHWTRGALLSLGTLCFFEALRHLPIPTTISIFFVEPFLIALLAAVFLGERFGWRRMLAILVGFAGAMLVIRPNFAHVGPAALLPMITALCFAIYAIVTRRRAFADSAIIQHYQAGLAGFYIFAALTLVSLGRGWPGFAFVWPDLREWGLLAGIGLVATIGNLMIIIAYRMVEPGAAAPLRYLEIITAVFISWTFFDELPDRTTALGAALIIGSGLYILMRERQLNRP